MARSTRFPISFDPTYAFFSKALFLPPSDSYVEIQGEEVHVRMAWAFRATFERAAVKGAAPFGERVLLTRGVHGFGGRWLVNGSGDGILTVDLEPCPRAYVMGFPVRLRQLLVSVDDPPRVAQHLLGRAS